MPEVGVELSPEFSIIAGFVSWGFSSYTTKLYYFVPRAQFFPGLFFFMFPKAV